MIWQVKQTEAGALTGWVKGLGDDFVDFNIFEGISAGMVASDGYSKKRYYLTSMLQGHSVL